MHGQLRITAGTLEHMTTILAGQSRGKASPVNEYQNLVPAFQMVPDDVQQQWRQAVSSARDRHVKKLDRGTNGVAGALTEHQMGIAA